MRCQFRLVDFDRRRDVFVHACAICGHQVRAPGADPQQVRRRCAGGRMPSTARRAKNYATASARHAVSNFPTASAEVVEQRLAECRRCELFDGTHCLHPECGCPMANKVNWAEQRCPIGNWGPVRPWVRYVRTTELIEATRSLQAVVPRTIDAVAGIPRSGLLPATVLATALHLPLFAVTPKGTLACLNTGDRSGGLADTQPRQLLLVDDTAHSGATLQRVKQRLPLAEVVTLAVYALPEVSPLVDFYAELLRSPHVLEWNIYSCPWSAHLALDLDGVICEDCPAWADDDGRAYLDWIYTVRPLNLPRYRSVQAIITARLEKYRSQTEAWLAEWGVNYQRLIMGPWPTIAERRSADVGSWKAHHVNSLRRVELFIESSEGLARQISRRCKRAWVICPDAGGSV